MWKRISRIYQIIAVMTLNVLILLLALLFVSDRVIPNGFDTTEKADLTQRNWGAVGVNYPYSRAFYADSYQYMVGRDIENLWQEYDRLAAEGHWQVHPWTGLTLRPFTGQFLNTDENGYRKSKQPSTTHDGKPVFDVWAFGGSTMFGWGLADDYTLTSQLQEALQDSYPDYQVRVSNFGIPWYFSSHELALFVTNLRENDPPDIVIFLDGLNEIQYLIMENTQLPLVAPLALAWESQIDEFVRPDALPWITLNPSFPPSRIAKQMGLQLTYDNNVWAGYAYAHSNTGAPTLQLRLDIALRDYLHNQRIITAICREYGITPYFLLQPLSFWEDDPNYQWFQEQLTENNDHPYFYDLTDTFDTVEPDTPLLVDRTHYSDVATTILAERIQTIILDTYEANP